MRDWKSVEERREYYRQYYKKNADRLREYHYQYKYGEGAVRKNKRFKPLSSDPRRRGLDLENEKLYNFKYQLKQNYKLDIEDYAKMYNQQNGCCKICGDHQSTLKAQLNVDHDHKTGKLRDLLCRKCNSGLGQFKDDYDLLIKAAEYLKRHKQKLK